MSGERWIEWAAKAAYAEDVNRADEDPLLIDRRWRDHLDEPDRERYRRIARAAVAKYEEWK